MAGSSDTTQVPGPEQVFGRYRLLSLLGQGAMGQVWRAHDSQTNRVVALKVLPARSADDQMLRDRFRRECRAVAQLAEPHVIPIHDFGDIDGQLYLNMRLIEGTDLRSLIRTGGALPPGRGVAIIAQVAAALQAAHDAGLVHRDVKPSNILLGAEDFAYLIDFGIAHAGEDHSLTSTGQTIGTFAYLAPEAIGAADQTDSRVDVYALACVLCECLTGRPPFSSASGVQGLIAAHLITPPPQPSMDRAGVPAAFDAVIARGMAKDPDDRYRSARELAAAARAAVGDSAGTIDQPVAGRRRRRISLSRGAPGPSVERGVRTEPWWRRHAVVVTAVCAVVVTGVAVPTIISATSRSTVENFPSLLSAKDINMVMGRSDLELIDRVTELPDPYYSVSPAECDPIDSIAYKAPYSRAGITNITTEAFGQTGNRGKESVSQLLGKAPSAAAAYDLLVSTISAWRACDERQYDDHKVKSTARITDTGTDTVTAVIERQGNYMGGKSEQCEHTFGINGDAVAEVFACAENVANKTKTIIGKILQRTRNQR